jgi:hypothetical protein
MLGPKLEIRQQLVSRKQGPTPKRLSTLYKTSAMAAQTRGRLEAFNPATLIRPLSTM